MTDPIVTQAAPKSTHYVSLHNNVIHPAMTSPAGYEDQHPTEWRPATATEIGRFKSGEHSVLDIQPLSLSPAEAEPRSAVPETITLAPDTDTALPNVELPLANPGTSEPAPAVSAIPAAPAFPPRAE